ncbi:alanine/glycine:cation symporter family protein [Pararhizobium haloflavum]|uniref:alanine/glycine:cation symporter family protein n=1 Tax=Pararhizobium haloflavum TaxID=2037914 RepID=UPI000C19055F|nr:alanine/glycine:cation symporter family protein [Pararhizobium haloflavum]
MITRMLAALAAVLVSVVPAAAQDPDEVATTLDQRINQWFTPVSDFVGSIIFFEVPIGDVNFPLIVGWLVLAAAVCTIYFGFVQFRQVKHSISLVKGDYSDPEDAGEVSHFQALTTALSATVGLGNIAGVAVAVTLGGPGATFWMVVAGILGMATKFTECTLGVKYRNEYADGRVSGGPMYYLSKGLAERGQPGLGRTLAIIFSICCVGGAVGGGNMFQVNQALQQVVGVTGGEASIFAGRGWLFGVIMAAIIGMVIIGGIKSIARVTEKVVPFMAIFYVVTGLAILAINYDQIGWAFGQIFAGAFTGEGVAGGVIGALIQGFRRAAFSNEAGIGSAPIAHSAVRTKEPVTEGYVALLEPFIDTVVICTMTALVIVISGELGSGLEGVELTSAAFASGASWFPILLAIAVVLFAFSTMLSWSYYGLKAWTYMFGEGQAQELVFKAIFCAFIILGASVTLDPVIAFSDSMLFAMSIPNIIGIYLLLPVVRREVRQYWAKIESGEITKFKNAAAEA